jgi:FemAB-related protein (PEP-CTERM system-associated)
LTLGIQEFEGPPEAWDAFAREQAGSTLCHRHGWRTVMARALDHECLWLAARDEQSAIRGILPLVRVRTRLFGHYLVSLPFLNYGGPIGSPEAVVALGDHAAELAERDGVRLLELRSRVPLPLGLPVSHRKITVVLDLPRSADALLKAFPAKLRSQVRRPFKDGFAVRFGADQVPAFYQVFSRHMRDLGTPVMPRAFFTLAAEALAGEAWFGCGYLAERPVAAGAGFVWNGEFEMTWASALRESNAVSANMGLYWAFMERAIEAGLTRFNFGRCTPEGSTHRFKRQWGGRDEPLWWYQRSAAGRPAETPSPEAGAYAWGPRIWKRLPLPLANWLGPRIVRGIP